jgi:broad specificity phosphatase PhoE
MLTWLGAVPTDTPIIILLRHAERPPLDLSGGDYTRPITPRGAALARTLGGLLGARLRTLRTSPLTRCRETAEALRSGAGAACPVVPDHLLGDPGVYVADARLAQETWVEHGHEVVMAHLASSGAAPLPGLAEPITAAHRLVEHMLAAGHQAGFHVFVTHDSVITATVAQTLHMALGKEDWPGYLEGAFFWQGEAGIAIAYRDLWR